MPVFDPKVDAALEVLTEQLRDQFPEIAKELDALTSQSDVAAVAKRLTEAIQAQPGGEDEISQLAREVFAPLRHLPAKAYQEALGVQVEPEDLLFQAPRSRLAQLDPNIEAAIAERAQFDGDVPELRSGRLPEGARPAIPVETTARNPVAVGRMLRQASEEVADEIQQLEFDHEQSLLAAGAEIDEDGNVRNLPAKFEGADLAEIRAPDPERYRRGQKPQPIATTTPTATELAALSKTDEQVAAYEALSTTQGRKSTVAVIRDLVAEALSRRKIVVEVNENPDLTREDVPVYAEWTTGLSSGPNSTQPRFSYIDIAAAVLAKKLLAQLAEVAVECPVLEVVAINTVAVRQVGWAARIVDGR